MPGVRKCTCRKERVKPAPEPLEETSAPTYASVPPYTSKGQRLADAAFNKKRSNIDEKPNG